MCCTGAKQQSIGNIEHHGSCFCGCEGSGRRPRFMTKKQMIGKLNEHLETLEDEVMAVKEQIAELKKKN